MTLPPLLFALLMWFIGTGMVVWLDSRPRATFATSLSVAGIVAVAAMVMVWFRAGDASVGGAYVGFAEAILIWGWHEMSFLMGVVAGPARSPCPPGLAGWARFRAATATVIHHEIAIALTAVLLFALAWGQPNQAAPLTFLLLFVLRLSAKFNLFLGVPNLSDEVFPAHLAYLKSYFRTRAMNPMFPVSVLLGLGIAAWCWAVAEATRGGASATATLLAGLAVLGVIEHLFLVLPLRDARMWRWASASLSASSNKAAEAATID